MSWKYVQNPSTASKSITAATTISAHWLQRRNDRNEKHAKSLRDGNNKKSENELIKTWYVILHVVKAFSYFPRIFIHFIWQCTCCIVQVYVQLVNFILSIFLKNDMIYIYCLGKWQKSSNIPEDLNSEICLVQHKIQCMQHFMVKFTLSNRNKNASDPKINRESNVTFNITRKFTAKKNVEKFYDEILRCSTGKDK